MVSDCWFIRSSCLLTQNAKGIFTTGWSLQSSLGLPCIESNTRRWIHNWNYVHKRCKTFVLGMQNQNRHEMNLITRGRFFYHMLYLACKIRIVISEDIFYPSVEFVFYITSWQVIAHFNRLLCHLTVTVTSQCLQFCLFSVVCWFFICVLVMCRILLKKRWRRGVALQKSLILGLLLVLLWKSFRKKEVRSQRFEMLLEKLLFGVFSLVI